MIKSISLIGILAVLLNILALQAVAAEPSHPAGKIISEALDRGLKILSDPDIHIPGPKQDTLLKEIADIIYARLDFQEFSARTIGPKWREFTPQQQKYFQQAMSDLLYYTYFKSLLQYHGEPIEYVGEMVSSKGDKVEVKTNFIYQGKPIPVNYRMLQKGDDWLVYDMFIESISIVQNYRGQFAEVLQKETPDQLIGLIRDKADELKAAADDNLTSPPLKI